MSLANESLRSISLFSGAGGLDSGLAEAGFEPILAVDASADACATYAANFSAARVVNADLLDLDARELRGAAGLGAAESVDLVAGAPPCAPFSKSGLWLEWKRKGLDPNAGLLGVFAGLVAGLQPRAFVFENVPGVASAKSPYRDTYLKMLRRLGSAGYTIDAAVINASLLGVPQARRRLIVVGSVADGGAGGWLTSLPVRPVVSAGEALAGLDTEPERGEAPSGKWGDLLREVPPGDNYLYFTAMRGYPEPKFEWRSRYWNFLLKLHPERPAPTIQAQPGPSTGPFHWDNRRLRAPELKRLFGYPDDYVFVGSRASMQRQIGDSVPPPVGRAIGLALRSGGVHDA